MISICQDAPITTFDTLVRAVARTGAAEPGPAVGTILDGNYELIERLACGGMATVYRAHDRALGRDVAVKIPNLRHAALLDMFDREARITAQLAHPNVVVLHHVGRPRGDADRPGDRPGDRPYLVLELLRGETLAARLARRGRLSTGEAIALLDAILQALAYVHARGVIHRDLSPRNVFITHDEQVKLLDFGVALEQGSGGDPVTRGSGTRGYMAPEHATQPDPRGDLWAAAVVFFECVTDQRPALDAALPADVPAAIRLVLTQALAADPAHRPATASEMRQAFRAAPLAPPRRWLRARKPIDAHSRSGVLELAVMLLAGIATFAMASSEPRPLPRAHGAMCSE